MRNGNNRGLGTSNYAPCNATCTLFAALPTRHDDDVGAEFLWRAPGGMARRRVCVHVCLFGHYEASAGRVISAVVHAVW